MKHRGRYLIRRAVRAVDHNLQSTQRQLGGKRALAKFNVATGRIVQAFSFAQFTGRHATQTAIKLGLNAQLGIVGEFVAVAVKKLDAVVGK